MEKQLRAELLRLLIGTNEQRRRFGQALYHFYRTLIFWSDKGLGFSKITAAWSAGAAAIFDAMASTLRELHPHEHDVALRGFAARALTQLADDLERGDHMLMPFLRWLERRFPELTAMMRAEDAETRIYDYELAHELASLFQVVAKAQRPDLIGELRLTVRELAPRGT